MKKKLLSILLLLCVLAVGMQSTSLAVGGSMDNFTSVRAYDGRFQDVPAKEWYYSNVASLYEMGLTDGQSAQLFGAKNQVSLAETLSFAARIHSTYYLGGAETGPSAYASSDGPWYAPYVSYLQSVDVIDSRFEGHYRDSATRAQVAGILSHVLPGEELDTRNGDMVDTAYGSGRYLADVTSTTPYREDILDLYRWGIAAGSDSQGSFRPGTTITRSELAAMLTRMVDPSLRVTLDWDLSSLYSAKGTTYSSLIRGDVTYHASHGMDDMDAIRDNVRYMLQNGSNTLKVRMTSGSVMNGGMDKMVQHYLDEAVLYLEQGYSQVGYRYDSQGNVTITFTDPSGSGRDKALQKAIEIHDKFWGDGTLKQGMSQREIARVYFNYLCANCEYDYTYSDASRTSYSALLKGKAVCQGYTGAYNLLLKLEGIECATAGTESHIWTTTVLDGTLYHIDVTWGDQSWGVDNRYFCMTPEYALSRKS